MKKTITLLTLFISVIIFSQELENYEATNGVNYMKGDTLTLNIGSGNNGSFQYFQIGGWGKGFSLASDANQFSRFGKSDSNPTKIFAGKNIYIKRINKDKDGRVTFIVSAKRGTNYNLFIEEAIQTCEIKDCERKNIQSEKTSEDKYDKLEKLQKLKDLGTITSEEFELEKKKILKN